MSSKTRKVVFFFPSFLSKEATAPLGILALATPLLSAGYKVRIIDSTITPDFTNRVMEEIHDAICLAVSVVTGPMIRETVAIAREAKKHYPDLPIILGGWHPSLMPDQTLSAEYVDFIVRGQGEDAMLELVQHLESQASPAGIAGVGYKDHGRPVLNTARELKPIREMPQKSYQLADFDAYENLCGRRWAMYISSFACPYSCAYCTNDSVYGRNWNALESKQVVDEMSDLVFRYRLGLIWVVDDNFLVDKERALLIAEGLIRSGVAFDWRIQSSVNLVSRLEIDELKLLHRSGLSQISHGLESASPKILGLMNKSFQKPEMAYSVVEKCIQAGIKPSFNVIFGFPGEGEKERGETIRFIMDLSRRSRRAEFWTNIFTPYPGSPIIREAAKLGLDVPTSLEGWVDFFPKYTMLPWLRGNEHQRVQITREYLRAAFDRSGIAADTRPFVAKLFDRAIRWPARWRLNHGCYIFPFEIWLRKALSASSELQKTETRSFRDDRTDAAIQSMPPQVGSEQDRLEAMN